MDTHKFGAPLALSLAIASVLHPGVADAQSSLEVYSDDFGGPNQSAPTGAARDTVISMGVPRLHAVLGRLVSLEGILGSHPMPPHYHPHTHPVPVLEPTIVIIDGVPKVVPRRKPPNGNGPPDSTTSSAPPGTGYTAPPSKDTSFSMDHGGSTTLETTPNPSGGTHTAEVPSGSGPGPSHDKGNGGGGNAGSANGNGKFFDLYTDAFDPSFRPDGVMEGV